MNPDASITAVTTARAIAAVSTVSATYVLTGIHGNGPATDILDPVTAGSTTTAAAGAAAVLPIGAVAACQVPVRNGASPGIRMDATVTAVTSTAAIAAGSGPSQTASGAAPTAAPTTGIAPVTYMPIGTSRRLVGSTCSAGNRRASRAGTAVTAGAIGTGRDAQRDRNQADRRETAARAHPGRQAEAVRSGLFQPAGTPAVTGHTVIAVPVQSPAVRTWNARREVVAHVVSSVRFGGEDRARDDGGAHQLPRVGFLVYLFDVCNFTSTDAFRQHSVIKITKCWSDSPDRGTTLLVGIAAPGRQPARVIRMTTGMISANHARPGRAVGHTRPGSDMKGPGRPARPPSWPRRRSARRPGAPA
ncbi:hypothetical protein KBTX_01900 [wastewater metagenome]|uniref:Uncharacterized protein n=2 Tax=unclassified sequences TaxID=12908 RepID=A0A5B8RFW4_9ZZZZ|nr:hypothetical protein KBTEX_01900 [uncultured organism]